MFELSAGGLVLGLFCSRPLLDGAGACFGLMKDPAFLGLLWHIYNTSRPTLLWRPRVTRAPGSARRESSVETLPLWVALSSARNETLFWKSEPISALLVAASPL